MATNFQILTYSTQNSLHLKLYGDFDGSSAHELINALLDNGKDFFEVFIDTNDLKTIYPFGKDLFQKKLRTSKNRLGNLIFLGRNEYELQPLGVFV